jgi:hypothetical protein
MTVLVVVVYVSVSGLHDRIMDIEKLSPRCCLEDFAMDSFVSASDTVHVNNAGWRIRKRAESKRVDASGEPVARPINNL